MASEHLPAVGELIDAAAERMRRAGVTKPRREANRLWAWLRRAPAGQAYLDRDRDAEAPAREAFERAVERRVQGEPMAYVLGTAGFRHLELLVDRRVLIPRPETEVLVDHALRLARSGRALDVCTGSGCLALALAQEGEFDIVVGSDISREALEVARVNASAHRLGVALVCADLAGAFSGERFDLVVANPPYIAEAEYDALDPSVRAWEPRVALVAGADGMGPTRAIVEQAGVLLAPGGSLVMELDSTRAGHAAAIARGRGFGDVHVLEDLFGRARYLVARRGQGI